MMLTWYSVLVIYIVTFDMYFLYLLRKSKEKPREKAFLSAAVFMIILWQITKALSLSFIQPSVVLALSRLAKVPPLFMAVFVLMFVKEHTRREVSQREEILWYAIASLVSILTVFTDKVLSYPLHFSFWGAYPSPAELTYIYLAFLAGVFIYSSFILLLSWLSSSGKERHRIKNLFFYLFVSSIAGVFTDTLAPLLDYPIPPLGGVMSSIFLAGVIFLITQTGLSRKSTPTRLFDTILTIMLVLFLTLFSLTLALQAYSQEKIASELTATLHEHKMHLADYDLAWQKQHFLIRSRTVASEIFRVAPSNYSSSSAILISVTVLRNYSLNPSNCSFLSYPDSRVKQQEYFFSWLNCSGSKKFVMSKFAGKKNKTEVYTFFAFNFSGIISAEGQEGNFWKAISLKIYFPEAEVILSPPGKWRVLPEKMKDISCPNAISETLALSNHSAFVISRRNSKVMQACIEARTPIKEFHSITSGWYEKYAVLSVVFIIAFMLLSAIAAKRLSEPLPRILEAFQNLAKGNLDTRLPIEGALEFRVIAKDFNLMAAKLQKLYSELENYKDRLEKKVEQKTRQLKKKMLEAQHSSQAVLHVLKDVLEAREKLDKSQKELLAANRQLKNIDKRKGEFMNVAAHELKTPLIPIVAYTEMILNHSKLSQEDRHRLGIVLSSAKRLQRLVQDILDINKLESGIMKFKMEPFDIAAEIRRLAEGYEPNIKAKGLRFTVKIPDRPVMVMGDYQRLNQVFANLLDNAYKFTEKGGITVEVREDKNKVWIYVKDTGMGISKEDQSKVFTKFFQADTSLRRKQGGTGLGLSICRRIVRHHGGDIFFTSTLGKGTTFYYFVPKLRRDSHGENKRDSGSG